MKPTKGDAVKFTDRFIGNSTVPWTSALKDTELLVVNLTIKTMVPFKIYTIYLMVNKMMYKININETGHFINNTGLSGAIVFEPFQNPTHTSASVGVPLNPQPVPVSTPAWAPSAPPQPSAPVSADEVNCTCPQCGAGAIDLLFSVKCTNPSCVNYK